jgi:putative Mg2+ transporter-C (MgtC) family protein
MQADWYALPDISDLIRISWRLGMAALMGALIGIEREWMRKAAGLRTHTAVALASAAFVLIAIETGAAQGDIAPVIQGVATGIGFIGAGTILKRSNDEEDIKGLTTAATLWLTAAVGVAAGSGHSEIALVCVVAAWIILILLSGVERLVPPRSDK